jgi:hypothetical protein
MYSQRHDRFRSHLTGREYHFTPDRTGAAKREALAKLKADDAAIRAANNSRALPILGRELTEAEHQRGNWMPDTRTNRQKVEQDAVHITQPKHDADHNPHASRVATLESQLANATTPADRARTQRRLNIARTNAAEFDQQLSERKAWEAHMSSPAVTDAIVYANAWLARLETNSSVPQEWVNGAKARLEQLRLTGDAEAFWKSNDAFECERRAALEQRTQTLDAEAAKVRAEAAEVRRESAEPVTTE